MVTLLGRFHSRIFPYVGLRVGGVPDVQLAEGQECDLSRQVHLVELCQDLGAHLVCLHYVVKQPGREGDMKEYEPTSLSNSYFYIEETSFSLAFPRFTVSPLRLLLKTPRRSERNKLRSSPPMCPPIQEKRNDIRNTKKILLKKSPSLTWFPQ